jgi:Amt family ammonium transporter
MVWTLVTGFLVMFMQAGFMMVEVGLCRAKNSAHTAGMNLMIYPLGCLGFWIYGFAIGWGAYWNGPVPDAYVPPLGNGVMQLTSGWGIGPNMKTEKDKDGKDVEVKDDKGNPVPDGTYKYGLIGTKGFCLNKLDDVSIMALFFFMMVFMDTTATIPTGAMAERWAWKNFCLYGLWVALPYCIYANWVWGGGWLAQMGVNWGLGHGAIDFAGSGVVHAMGGVLSVAGVMVLGPRIGKYIDGKPRPIPAHNVAMVVGGTFILAFGWFGFNPGSTLAGTDLRISIIVVNTMLASVTGGLAAMVTLMIKGMKPDTTMMCNGLLSGLVAITAPCAFVDSWAAAVIGAVAGFLVVISVFFWEKIGIDDPVGAISVHGVNGIWGLISVGIFANGKYGIGLNGVERYAHSAIDATKPLEGDAKNKWLTDVGYAYDGVRCAWYGDWGQLKAQLIDAGVVIVFGFIMGYVWFKISNLITPIRVSAETEMAGLDVPEMGVEGYPDFTVAKMS